MNRSLVALGGFIVLCLVVGLIGSAATQSSVHGWYATLAKPSFTPPNWIFPVAWTFLYLAMALAAWLVWRSAGFTGALVLWGLQLGLNLLWSCLFFGLRSPALAFADIVALWIAIVATMTAFFVQKPAAGWLLTPYLAWVSYAAILNGAIWLMN